MVASVFFLYLFALSSVVVQNIVISVSSLFISSRMMSWDGLFTSESAINFSLFVF